jgi:hypothetical protein
VVTDGETVIASVALPLLQEYTVPPEAVRVVLAPTHTVPSLLARPEVSSTLITGTGNGFTVTTEVVVALQLFAFVTVTV